MVPGVVERECLRVEQRRRESLVEAMWGLPLPKPELPARRAGVATWRSATGVLLVRLGTWLQGTIAEGQAVGGIAPAVVNPTR